MKQILIDIQSVLNMHGTPGGGLPFVLTAPGSIDTTKADPVTDRLVHK
jgi:hypothetical protein